MPGKDSENDGGRAEPMHEHVGGVAARAAGFADIFGAADQARMTGLLHDLGKYSERFLDTRMLFSALVDADFLETEAHFDGDAQSPRRCRPVGPPRSETGRRLSRPLGRSAERAWQTRPDSTHGCSCGGRWTPEALQQRYSVDSARWANCS